MVSILGFHSLMEQGTVYSYIVSHPMCYNTPYHGGEICLRDLSSLLKWQILCRRFNCGMPVRHGMGAVTAMSQPMSDKPSSLTVALAFLVFALYVGLVVCSPS